MSIIDKARETASSGKNKKPPKKPSKSDAFASRGPGRPVSVPIFDKWGNQLPEEIIEEIKKKRDIGRTFIRNLFEKETSQLSVDQFTSWVEDPESVDLFEYYRDESRSATKGMEVEGRIVETGAADPANLQAEVDRLIDEEQAAERAAKAVGGNGQSKALLDAGFGPVPTKTEYLRPMGVDWERGPADVKRPVRVGPQSLEWERPWNAERPRGLDVIAGLEEGEESRRLLRQDMDPMTTPRVPHPMDRYDAQLRKRAAERRGGTVLEESLKRVSSRRAAPHALLSAGASKVKKVASLAKGRLGKLGLLGVAAAAFDVDMVRGAFMGDEERARQDEKAEREWQLQSAMQDARLQYRMEQARARMQQTNPTWYDILRGLPPKTSNEIVINEKAPNEQNLAKTLASQEIQKDPATFAAHFGMAGE